jgi:hypothetical protein
VATVPNLLQSQHGIQQHDVADRGRQLGTPDVHMQFGLLKG